MAKTYFAILLGGSFSALMGGTSRTESEPSQ